MSENKMIMPPWVIDEIRDEIHIIGANSYGESICALYSDPMDEDVRANARAIVSAVNNTYGSGVNPEAVPELLNALKFVRDAPQFNRMDWKLKVTIDAAIAKAKLI